MVFSGEVRQSMVEAYGLGVCLVTAGSAAVTVWLGTVEFGSVVGQKQLGVQRCGVTMHQLRLTQEGSPM